MNFDLNEAKPQIMHIDLNSCFASVEQQARPLLRGRPLAVTNRLSVNACVVAASYEAKSQGVKVGMRLGEAKLLAPDLIMVETDPPKYHYVYQVLAGIMKSYSPNISMKSIDEGVIDFTGTRQNMNKRRYLDGFCILGDTAFGSSSRMLRPLSKNELRVLNAQHASNVRTLCFELSKSRVNGVLAT